MSSDNQREFSDLKIERKECSHCGATWINGQHRWRTGKTSETSELDLAGLVCNTSYGNPSQCINPKKGLEGGDTWEKRSEFADMQAEEVRRQNEQR